MMKYTREQLEKWLLERGTIKGAASTVTYEYSGGAFAATTVAPTTAQAVNTVLLTAQLQMGDTDTVATITHNWGLSAGQNTGLMPLVKYWLITGGVPTTALPITFALNTNTVVVSKASGTGSGGTWAVILEKPHTLVQ